MPGQVLRLARPTPKGSIRFALDPKLFPVLTQLGKNLTLAAARGELEAVVGRDDEIERTLDVLAKRRANSPCLVGAAGVGKTSVARGVAQRIASGPSPMTGETDSALDDRIVIELEPTALLAGTGVRGALAERLVQIKAEAAKANGRVVLFLDDVHVLLSEGGDEGVTELKTALGKGELACIAATTEADYKRTVLPDAALARRFTPIEVLELSAEDAFLALEQVVPAFGKHHGVTFSPEALASSVTWSTRYLPGRALPDKAIGILDLAGARARRRSQKEVGPVEIADVVSEMSGVPTDRLLESDGERMLRLEELMARRIVGHTSALSRIAKVLRRNASGFRAKRPIGSFLLLGPTGVGKTETAKAIAECLFHSPTAMTRLDLSEYAEPHSIARLVGAPPGYVGHESGGSSPRPWRAGPTRSSSSTRSRRRTATCSRRSCRSSTRGSSPTGAGARSTSRAPSSCSPPTWGPTRGPRGAGGGSSASAGAIAPWRPRRPRRRRRRSGSSPRRRARCPPS